MYGLISPLSKTLTAEQIHALLPKADTLVDIMAGGCAVSQVALERSKYVDVIANDTDDVRLQLFTSAIRGELRHEHRWISREDFYMLRESDPYVWYCWSANNEGRSYIYNSTKEQMYGYAFRMITLPTEEGRWQALRDFTQAINQLTNDIRIEDMQKPEWSNADDKHKVRIESCSDIIEYFIQAYDQARLQKAFIGRLIGSTSVDHYFRRSAQWLLPNQEAYEKLQLILPRLTRPYNEVRTAYEKAKTQYDFLAKGKTVNERLLQELGTIEPFNTLDNLRDLELTKTRAACFTPQSTDYANVEIPKGSIIYCDPPHIGEPIPRGEYPFDYQRFYQWATNQQVPVFITEYSMPDSLFRPIADIGTANAEGKVERLWIPINQKNTIIEQGNLF